LQPERDGRVRWSAWLGVAAEPVPTSDSKVAATISVLTEMGKQLREIQTLHQEVIDHLVGSQQSTTKGERARKGKRRKGWLFPDDA